MTRSEQTAEYTRPRPSQKIVLICTVGTGTAGADSFVAHGILVGVQEVEPDALYLCPSSSPNSRDVAELVADEWAKSHPQVTVAVEPLSDHDDLERCIRELRNLVRRVQSEYPNAAVLLNPTSGTKQMTTAAVLAGLEEGVERIDFVVGERRDGVVRTGTERVVPVHARRILARQTARNALSLVRAGAFRGAERILETYADLFPKFLALTRALGFWNRFAYRRALQAVPPDDSFSSLRKTLHALAQAPLLSVERAADMVAFADRALEAGEPEEALAVLYRAAELLAKVRLRELGLDVEHPSLENIEETLHPPKPLFDRISNILQPNSTPFLGLATLYELLAAAHEPPADRIYSDSLTWECCTSTTKRGTDTVCASWTPHGSANSATGSSVRPRSSGLPSRIWSKNSASRTLNPGSRRS